MMASNDALPGDVDQVKRELLICPGFLRYPRRPRSTFIALGVVQRVGGEA